MAGTTAVFPVEKKTSPLAEYLKKIPLWDVINTKEFIGKDLITVNENDDLNKVLHVLNRARIHAVPVKKGDQIIGLVDLLDIVKYLCTNQQSLGDLTIQESQVMKTPVSKVVNFSYKDPMIPIFEGNPAYSAAEVLARGIHRVLVFNEQKNAVGLCSQSDLIAFLNAKKEAPELSSFMQAPLTETCGGLPTAMFDVRQGPQVLHIEPQKTVLEGLEKLARTGASALAVIDPNTGKLVGDFEVSDLRGMVQESLKETLADHLAKHGKRKPCVESLGSFKSLGDIISALAKDRKRHIWIGEGEKPNAIITMTDAIRSGLGLS